jgi:hypothetical protein
MRPLSGEVRPRRPLLLHCKHEIDPLLLLILLVVAVVAAVRQVAQVGILLLLLILPLARPPDIMDAVEEGAASLGIVGGRAAAAPLKARNRPSSSSPSPPARFRCCSLGRCCRRCCQRSRCRRFAVRRKKGTAGAAVVSGKQVPHPIFVAPAAAASWLPILVPGSVAGQADAVRVGAAVVVGKPIFLCLHRLAGAAVVVAAAKGDPFAALVVAAAKGDPFADVAVARQVAQVVILLRPAVGRR